MLVLRPEDEALRACRIEREFKDWVRDNADHPRVVVSLEKLPIISSAGLATLVILHRTLGRSGGSIRLAEACEEIIRLMRFTKLDTFFRLDPTVDDAVARLNATPPPEHQN